jgi:outer membrane protein assembly factor BamB
MPATTAASGPLNNVGLFPPATSDDLAVACLQTALDSSRSFQTTMVAVGLGDGKLRWNADIAGVPLTLPEIDGDQIFVCQDLLSSGDAQLVAAYALQTGARLWTYTLGQL